MTADNAALTAWMLASGQGDADAFGHLARALAPDLLRVATRLMQGDSFTAEDVLQDVLVKLWVYAPRWKPEGSVGAYATRLVHTTAMDRWRTHKPMATLDDTDRADPAPSALERLMGRRRAQTVRAAVGRLPVRQQEAVARTYWGENQTPAVAAAMGTTPKAVESLLGRARETLGKRLRRQDL